MLHGREETKNILEKHPGKVRSFHSGVNIFPSLMIVHHIKHVCKGGLCLDILITMTDCGNFIFTNAL